MCPISHEVKVTDEIWSDNRISKLKLNRIFSKKMRAAGDIKYNMLSVKIRMSAPVAH